MLLSVPMDRNGTGDSRLVRPPSSRRVSRLSPGPTGQRRVSSAFRETKGTKLPETGRLHRLCPAVTASSIW